MLIDEVDEVEQILLRITVAELLDDDDIDMDELLLDVHPIEANDVNDDLVELITHIVSIIDDEVDERMQMDEMPIIIALIEDDDIDELEKLVAYPELNNIILEVEVDEVLECMAAQQLVDVDEVDVVLDINDIMLHIIDDDEVELEFVMLTVIDDVVVNEYLLLDIRRLVDIM